MGDLLLGCAGAGPVSFPRGPPRFASLLSLPDQNGSRLGVGCGQSSRCRWIVCWFDSAPAIVVPAVCLHCSAARRLTEDLHIRCCSVFGVRMFAVHGSYCSLLRAICGRVNSVSANFLTEISEDRCVLHGVEIVLLAQASDAFRIFWDCDHVGCLPEFECASLQAVVFLQSIYGFVVVDYSYYGMLTYRTLARAAVDIARAALGCCHSMLEWNSLSDKKKNRCLL